MKRAIDNVNWQKSRLNETGKVKSVGRQQPNVIGVKEMKRRNRPTERGICAATLINDVNQFLNEFQESGKTNHERALTMFDAMHLFEDHIDHNDDNPLIGFDTFIIIMTIIIMALFVKDVFRRYFFHYKKYTIFIELAAFHNNFIAKRRTLKRLPLRAEEKRVRPFPRYEYDDPRLPPPKLPPRLLPRYPPLNFPLGGV
ncbi:hypothetical protein BLOT_006542 [Blomia tropicalis]|nr:hypothetical protein BLOT_006542 [Blomia tropicalis]